MAHPTVCTVLKNTHGIPADTRQTFYLQRIKKSVFLKFCKMKLHGDGSDEPKYAARCLWLYSLVSDGIVCLCLSLNEPKIN
jgi:hypothetical protein